MFCQEQRAGEYSRNKECDEHAKRPGLSAAGKAMARLTLCRGVLFIQKTNLSYTVGSMALMAVHAGGGAHRHILPLRQQGMEMILEGTSG